MGSIRGEGGAGGGGGGLVDLVDDTTPQLGGNLDVNGFNVGGVTPTELGYLSGATSAIQTQLGNKQASNANLDALAGQTGAADRVSYWTAAATLALATLTAFGRSLIAAADAAGVRTLLGLGTAATTDASAYQANDAELTALAGLTSAADKGIQFTGSGTAATYDLTAAGKALLDDADAAAQLVTLGAVGAASPVLTGTVVVRQTGGVAGTDEIQLSHDGANGKIESKDGSIFLKGASFFAYRSDDVLLASVDSSGGLFAYRFWITGFDVWLERVSSGRARIGGGIDGHGILDASSFESKVATGTAPLTVASTTVVTNLNADKLDGKDATDFAPCTQATLTAAASVALDFAAAGLATLTTDQNTTFTASNRAAGRQPYNLRIIGGGAHTLTFPAGWKWLNSTMPAAIASGKTGRLCLECYGTADTDVVASFAVEA